MSGQKKNNPTQAKQVEKLNRRVKELTEQLEESRLECKTVRQRLESKEQELQEAREAQQKIREISEQLEKQSMLLEKDREVARELQRSLTPVWMDEFAGVEFGLESRPGVRIAGDFYDLVKLSDDTFAFLIADVSGYGLPAAVIMATARMAFRTYAGQHVSPRKIMNNVNESLLQSTLAGHYLTAFLGVLDTQMLTLQYTNASHCCPFLLREDEMSVLDTDGLLVGMFDDPQYEEKCMELEPNDKLFLFTDGLIRQFEEQQGDEEGEQSLRRFLKDHHEDPVKDLIEVLSDDVLCEPQDDVVMLAFEVLRKKRKEKVITIPSIPDEMMRVEDTILPTLSAKGYGERSLFGIRLALEEAVINAIKHGNELDSTKKVTIRFSLDDKKFDVGIEDEGEGFDPDEVPDPWSEEGLLAESGRGVALMRAYMDDVWFEEEGSRVNMRKYAPWVPENARD